MYLLVFVRVLLLLLLLLLPLLFLLPNCAYDLPVSSSTRTCPLALSQKLVRSLHQKKLAR